jgi:hypothetical protein
MGVSIRPRGMTVLAALSLLLGVGCGSSVPKTAAVPWDALTDSQDLVGASQQTSDYVGTLVLLPCTPMRGEKGMQCDPSGRRPGLMIPGDNVVHVLVAGDTTVRQKLESPKYQGKQVLVTGILHPTLKAIVVGNIDLQHGPLNPMP